MHEAAGAQAEDAALDVDVAEGVLGGLWIFGNQR